MKDATEIRKRLKADLAEILDRDDAVRASIRQRGGDENMNFEDLGLNGEFDDVLDTLGDRSRTELLAIRSALQRVDSGTYGTCTNCGRKIDPERLEAMPATEYCVECASRLENG